MEREISKRKAGKSTNMWKLNKTLPNDKRVSEEIKRKIKNYLKINENGKTAFQNIQKAATAALIV